MSSHHNHIIRNLHLEVEFQQHNDAFTLRNTLAEVCKAELLPALEKLFNEKTRSGKVIKSNEIVIDLGTISKENWSKILVERVIKELTEHFKLAKPLSDMSSQYSREDETERVMWEKSDTVTEISEEDNSIQSILHFLRTGLLPWYTMIKSQGEFVRHFNQLMNKSNTYFHKQILAIVWTDENTLIRLVDQVPEEVLKSFALQSGLAAKDIQVHLNFWTKMFEHGNIPTIQLKKLVYRAVLDVLSEVFPEKPSHESISEHLVGILTKDQHQKISVLFHRPDQSFQVMDEVEKKILQAVRNLIIQKHTSEGGEFTSEGYDSLKGSTPAADPSHTDNKNLLQGRNKKKQINDTEEDGLFIANAGLVILHPFLFRLFENVGYVEEKKWISENHQQRAIMLTQYLVTGRQEYPEFDLLLNKLMTGYPLESSLPSDMLLSDFEIQEAEDVLKSVLTHWKVLKNTSIPGLQTTFLQRDGKLQFNDDRWLLQIERKTVDILLDKLPWGIGIIKLPWMENRLHVEWT